MLLLLAAVLLLPRCTAEEQLILEQLGIDEVVKFAADQGFDIETMIWAAMNGEVSISEGFLHLFNGAKGAVINDIRRTVEFLIAPVVAMLMIKLMMREDESICNAATLICRIGCIAVLADLFAGMKLETEQLLNKITDCADLLTPVMIAAVSLAGAETTALFLSPLTGIAANLIQHILAQWGVAVCSLSAVISFAGNLSKNVRLKRLHSLCRSVIRVGAGGTLAGFMAVVTLQGRLGAGRDSAAVRTARYAIENIIPIIGGNVSDSLDSLLTTVNIAKNSVGVSLCILIAYICLAPIVRMLGTALFLRLMSAITEPLDDDALTAMVGQLGASVEMLMVVCIAAATLCVLLIGSCITAASNVVR